MNILSSTSVKMRQNVIYVTLCIQVEEGYREGQEKNARHASELMQSEANQNVGGKLLECPHKTKNNTNECPYQGQDKAQEHQ